MKPDQPMTNNDREVRKSQGVSPAVPPARKEGSDLKVEDKKKIKPGKLAQSTGHGR